MRVLIVDDHTLVRAGLSRLLQGFADVEVAATVPAEVEPSAIGSHRPLHPHFAHRLGGGVHDQGVGVDEAA